jgi:hypothetical protein
MDRGRSDLDPDVSARLGVHPRKRWHGAYGQSSALGEELHDAEDEQWRQRRSHACNRYIRCLAHRLTVALALVLGLQIHPNATQGLSTKAKDLNVLRSFRQVSVVEFS